MSFNYYTFSHGTELNNCMRANPYFLSIKPPFIFNEQPLSFSHFVQADLNYTFVLCD